MSIELLLTDARTLTPVTDDLSGAAATLAPSQVSGSVIPAALRSQPDALDVQRWGVVVERSADYMLQWIEPLLALRREQCKLAAGEEIVVFRVDRGMTPRAARDWRISTFARIATRKRPSYLLILGDLDQVSLALQRELMKGNLVGRLCFTDERGAPDPDGYRAYCAKLSASEAERRYWDRDPRLLVSASRNEDDAVLEVAYTDLARRCARDAARDSAVSLDAVKQFGRYRDHGWYTESPDPDARARTVMHWAGADHPSILVTVCHGVGVSDPSERRLRQGALVLEESRGQTRRELWDHTRFADRRFLPGGLWLLSACFGAGTPSQSLYEPWLSKLTDHGYRGLDSAMASRYLASREHDPDGGGDFVARLPQVVLANPDGPLGVIGHVDLAWTYGYQDPYGDDRSLRPDADHSPYYDAVRAAALGSRLGNAAAALSDKAAMVADDLSMMYLDHEARGEALKRHEARRAWLWMQHLDLSGYILLGDPAAQLPVRAARMVHEASEQRYRERVARGRRASIHATRDLERAVLRSIQGDPDDAIAADLGVAEAALRQWVAAYRDAGCAAVCALAGADDDDS